jgi:hypothetical protein
MTKVHAALVRAGRSAAQAAVALVGSAQFVEAIDWKAVLSGSALMALMSLLTSAAFPLPESTPLPPPVLPE